MGARVQWPADMPDDILEFAINSTHDILKTHDIAKDGMKVVLKMTLDC